MASPAAIEWHRNKQSPCEVCGARVVPDTLHRALTVVESEASKFVMGGDEGAGYVIGYTMGQVAPSRYPAW
jgi:hypothetical protein